MIEDWPVKGEQRQAGAMKSVPPRHIGIAPSEAGPCPRSPMLPRLVGGKPSGAGGTRP